MPTALPNFLIIGAMRSGTTSLFHYLRGHPDVFMPRVKDTRYFDLHFSKGLEWYKAQFSGANGQRAVGEASPAYMSFEEAPARMAQVIPQARLIAILRNPVDRAYSHYWHNQARGREPLGFVDAIAAEPERIASAGPTQRRDHNYSYLNRGRYLAQLQRVCQYYPREALQVLLFEDFRDAPLQTFQSLCRFLEIDDTFVPLDLGAAVNPYVSFRSPRLRDFYHHPWFPRLPVLQQVLGRFNTRRGVAYPPLDPALRAELQRQFEKDNAALAAWLGRDLSCWNPRRAASGLATPSRS